MAPRPTCVYVDGFNFYYGSVRRTRLKWVDLFALARCVLPAHLNDVVGVKYFTATVSATLDDPSKPTRQDTYIRALEASGVEVIRGHFLTNVKQMAQAIPIPGTDPPEYGRGEKVWVWKTEEKGSDVSLGAHLIADAYEGRFEVGVVITNDSDLAEPIRLVRQRRGLAVGVLRPENNFASAVLEREATFFKTIRKAALRASQFPDPYKVGETVLYRPDGW